MTVFGDDLDINEISVVSEVIWIPPSLSSFFPHTLLSHLLYFVQNLNGWLITWCALAQVLKQLNRPILYSLSPGTSVTPAMAKAVSGLTNMYRITGDDWDSWGDVVAHFDVTRWKDCSISVQEFWSLGYLSIINSFPFGAFLPYHYIIQIVFSKNLSGTFLPLLW